MVYCQKESTTIVYGPIEFALLIKTFAKDTNSSIGLVFLREIKGYFYTEIFVTFESNFCRGSLDTKKS